MEIIFQFTAILGLFIMRIHYLPAYLILVPYNPGADLIKLFFFANKEFFRFLLVSLSYIQQKLIYSKTIWLNAEEKIKEKKVL
jgi:hypothetical protein